MRSVEILVAERGLQGAQAWLPHGMWGLLGPRPEPVSPALAGGFLATGGVQPGS